MPTRNYTYYDFTLSLCTECLRRIDAKIIFENGKVYMLKRCHDHGTSKVLIADDIEYYKNIRNYNKPSDLPHKWVRLKLALPWSSNISNSKRVVIAPY